jgi:hypothetical protein
MSDTHGQLVTPFGFASTTSEVLDGIDLTGKTALMAAAADPSTGWGRPVPGRSKVGYLLLFW